MLAASDSFHPLLAEVTHNETADPTVTFHLPEHEATSESSPPQSSREECSFSTHAEEFDSTEPSAHFSEASPECLRAEEPSSCSRAVTVLHQSFCQLTTSQCHPHESVLMASPVAQEVDLAALSLHNLTLCDATPTLSMLPPEGGDAEKNCISERERDPISSTQRRNGELKLHEGSHLWNPGLIWDKIQVAALSGCFVITGVLSVTATS